MAANEYRFVTRWKIKASPEEVSLVLDDPEDLVRWWPSVYRESQVLEWGDESGVGKRVRLLTKGWLPYRLRWQFRVVESRKPYGWTLEADGDLIGRGIWTFSRNRDETVVTYDWRIRAEKPLIRAFSPLFKPIFRANHCWAMAQGERALRQEISKRREGRSRARKQAVARQRGCLR